MAVYMNGKFACNAFDKFLTNEFSFLLRKRINFRQSEIFRYYFFFFLKTMILKTKIECGSLKGLRQWVFVCSIRCNQKLSAKSFNFVQQVFFLSKTEKNKLRNSNQNINNLSIEWACDICETFFNSRRT